MSFSTRRAVWLLLLIAPGGSAFCPRLASAADRLAFSTEDDGVTITCDGKLFTRYLFRSGRRPVLWPVMGPTDQPMTRAYPVAEGPVAEGPDDEPRDHPHHRSLWIGYEGINEHDFWHQPEAERTRPFAFGEQVHRAFSQLKVEGDEVVLAAEVDWLDAQGKRVLQEVRTLRFGCGDDRRWIDWQSELKATDGPVRIGDSKEGLVSIRVPASMAVDAQQGGRIVTSRGLTDGAMWGQPAEWVDYQGPVGGEKLGIAMLAHPDSFHSPPRWHTRTYGLMGANPFAETALASENPELPVAERPLSHTIPAGETLLLRYRFIFHKGDEKAADIAGAYAEFAE